jgi:hypothetical protein
MVTVPACSDCNGRKEPLDSYLRDVLVSDIHASKNPVARKIQTGKLSRSVVRNRSHFIRNAIPNAQLRPMVTPTGIYIGHGVSVPVDDKKIRQELRFMVRGLFYWVREERIPDDYRFEIDQLMYSGIGSMWDYLESKGEGAGQIGENVFACRYQFCLGNPFISYWLLVFYSSVGFGIMTVPPGGLDAVSPGG